MKRHVNLKESALKKRLLRLAAMGICAAVLAASVPAGTATIANAETTADDPADNPADNPTDGPADNPADEPTDDPADDPVVAQEQEITVKVAEKKYTGDSIKKSKKTFKIGASAMTDISYEVTKGSEYVSVSKKGVVTVKKNTPAGKYKIKVTAEATEEYKKAATTVTVTVTKPTPEMKKAYITWDLKENKAVRFNVDFVKSLYNKKAGIYDLASSKKTGTVTVKNFKKVSKGKKYKLTYTVEYTLPTDFSRQDVDDAMNLFIWAENAGEMMGLHWFVGAYDYQTGKSLDEKNSFNVKTKYGEWKESGTKKIDGSDGAWMSFSKTASINMTITYPKDYKDLCIIAGGSRDTDAMNGVYNDFTAKDGKPYYHGMRVK